MDEHIHVPMLSTSMLIITIISFILLLTTLPRTHCSQLPPSPQPRFNHTICKEQSYGCRELSSNNISYPFWDGNNRPEYCGGGEPFHLICQEGQNSTTIVIGSQEFTVMKIDPEAHTMRLKRTDLAHDVCSPHFDGDSSYYYFNGSGDLFRYPQNVYNLTVSYDCPTPKYSSPSNYSFNCGDDKFVIYEAVDEAAGLACGRHTKVPTDAPLSSYSGGGKDALRGVIDAGFLVNYTVNEDCVRCLGGRTSDHGDCWNSTNDTDIEQHVQSSCYYSYCPDGSASTTHCSAPHKNKLNLERKLMIGVASSVLGALLAVNIGLYLYKRQRNKRQKMDLNLCKPRTNGYAMSYIQSGSLTSSDPSSKDPEKESLRLGQSQNFGVHVFTYSELEKATNYFHCSRELGEGGFGTVYFGKLRDGRCVAVKRLYEKNYKRVEQFMNEVQILARLVHPNLVSLYGCTSLHSSNLLLVYEYVPNGTVADHLHGRHAKPGKLPWSVRMNIAVEIADALKYLHVSDIIHRDIKTNNILLDNHFRVKVADFGLSRLFPNNLTHVTTAPQGTLGYMDPEYHQCYKLTYKSDVYSFGVVLVELISSLPAVDLTRHNTHEINLANMAISKIQNQALHELVDPTLGFESDHEVREMINAVAELAFQCLQDSRELRPSMKQVLETLEGIKKGTWGFSQIT